MTTKGELTKQSILEHALALAGKVGLEGLSIGRLAEDLGLSKSGLFAHFQSKEALQLGVLELAKREFVDRVVKPGLTSPRGEPRVRAVFEKWLAWGKANPGGCIFVNTSVEFDDIPGPIRDAAAQSQRDWQDVLSGVAKTAISEGDFDADLDPEQFAFEMWGTMLAWHHNARLLEDPKAEKRARAAFEALLTRCRAKSKKR